MFARAGIENVEGAYTPISLGKGNKERNGLASWISNLRKVDFHDSAELRALTPENVTEMPVYVNGQNQTKYKAIVGDNTSKVYSIKSNRYQPVQHGLMMNAIADASEQTGITVFGKMNDEGGRMSIHAYFADPDCNVDLGGTFIHGENKADPFMLGVRGFNSHTGQTGFGAEIVGIRAICSNMCGFGDVLGRVSWKHFVKEENVADLVSQMISGYMDKVPVLKDRIEAMRNEEITISEAECLLWGIRVGPFKTEGIMAHLPELNPEIRYSNGKVSVYDMWNATTAYNTYSNTGGSEFNRMDFANRASDLITADIARVIDAGAVARQKYLDSLKEIDLTGATVVGE